MAYEFLQGKIISLPELIGIVGARPVFAFLETVAANIIEAVHAEKILEKIVLKNNPRTALFEVVKRDIHKFPSSENPAQQSIAKAFGDLRQIFREQTGGSELDLVAHEGHAEFVTFEAIPQEPRPSEKLEQVIERKPHLSLETLEQEDYMNWYYPRSSREI